MIHLHDIRYVRLGTRDLESAAAFATKIVGLELASKDGKWAYFKSDRVKTRGDTRDHTLAYFEGDPADHVIGLELKHPDDFDQVGSQLDNANFPVRMGTKEECEQRRVNAFIATQDPTGNKIEILARPFFSGVRYFPGRDAGITHFSHIGLNTTDPKRDEKFWTTVFNARVSDWLGDTPLFRIATAHHSVVLFPTTKPGVQHINHQVEDIDDVMRSWYFLKEKGVKILLGPGRHPLSTAVMLYFRGPDGMVYEYSCGVKHILPGEEATYRPRQFAFDQYAVCMWGSRPDAELSAFPQTDEQKPPLRAVMY
jgi:2,3-dihydroxy-p-cumate/2,3-dihydroxybenzoate 3,4-dioxygenase